MCAVISRQLASVLWSVKVIAGSWPTLKSSKLSIQPRVFMLFWCISRLVIGSSSAKLLLLKCRLNLNVVLYCIVLYCIVLYCIVLYCIVFYCILFYFILSLHLYNRCKKR